MICADNLYVKYLDRDNSDLSEIVELFADGLVRFAYCYLRDSAAAEDVMEETFAVLIVKRKKFSDNAALKSYLYKVARSKSIDYLRFHRRFTPLDDLENVFSCESAETAACKNETYEHVYRCLQQMPPQYRDVLSLVYLEQFSIAETSRILGKNAKQTYNLIARAKASFKEMFKREMN